jgi:hypothetical protein
MYPATRAATTTMIVVGSNGLKDEPPFGGEFDAPAGPPGGMNPAKQIPVCPEYADIGGPG